MLKKIVNAWVRLTTPWEATIAAALIPKIDPVVDAFFESIAGLAVRNIDLERQLRGARTRASKNGCLALLAFGLIAIEILGVTLYFLPK